MTTGFKSLNCELIHATYMVAGGRYVAARCGMVDILDPRTDAETVTCIPCLATPCDHGIAFPEDHDFITAVSALTVSEIRRMYPRLDGRCPRGCGFHGIAYASHAHYVYGDW